MHRPPPNTRPGAQERPTAATGRPTGTPTGAGICYTRAELIELSGRIRRSAVIRWLHARRVAFIEDADGWPKVLRASILDQQPTAPHHSEPRLRLV